LWKCGRLDDGNGSVFYKVRLKARDWVEDDGEERVIFGECLWIRVDKVDGGIKDDIFAMTYLSLCPVRVDFEDNEVVEERRCAQQSALDML
jgi:hypothetical protein